MIFGLLFVILTLASQALARYRWISVIANGVTTSPYEFVRQNTNYNAPVTDVTSNDLRCNVGAMPAGTLTVTAGSTLGFALDQAINYPGVVNVYMSRAPGTAASYDGSGQWFKIFQMSAETHGSSKLTFPSQGLSSVIFRIPASVPSGEYLLRVEHIALQAASSPGGAQFYIACAQLDVIGGGSGTPSPTVSIPGVYKATDPSILIDLYSPATTTYVQPGPAVWSG